jgi:porin
MSATSCILRLGGCVLLLVTLDSGAMSSDEGTFASIPPRGLIYANAQASYDFVGNDFLGRTLGFSDASGIRIGGYLVPELDWVASGGVEPNSAFGSYALGLHASLDTKKALNIPGGTWGVEFLLSDGGANINAAGSVQQYTNMTATEPIDRQDMTQLWWRQRLFDDKLIVQIGKMNGAGHFNTVLKPVIVSEPHLQDHDISNLIYVPVGLNPTLFGRLPAYPDTAYGAVVHFMPTTDLSVSYGLFDGNGARGVATGDQWLPELNGYRCNIAEVSYSWRLGGAGKPGRMGLGAWWQTGEFYTPALTTEDNGKGYYLFANQRLFYSRSGTDNSGVIGYAQFGHTGSESSIVKTYWGAGLTGLGLVPGRRWDTLNLGLAFSRLNDTPGAGAFFYPDISSDSTDLRSSELMLQAAYQANFAFGTPANYWTLSAILAYSYIPTPGQRPDLPAANVLTARLVALF